MAPLSARLDAPHDVLYGVLYGAVLYRAIWHGASRAYLHSTRNASKNAANSLR